GSAAMLLAWLGERRRDANLTRAAQAIEAALDAAIADPASRTLDLGGTLGTDAFGEKVAAALSCTSPGRGEGDRRRVAAAVGWGSIEAAMTPTLTLPLAGGGNAMPA